MLGEQKPQYQSVDENKSQRTFPRSSKSNRASSPWHDNERSDESKKHELKDFERIDVNRTSNNDSTEISTATTGNTYQYTDATDPTIYALLHKRPTMYTNAIDENSLVANKETVTPIMHFNPYFEIIAITIVVFLGWFALLMYYIDDPPFDPNDFAFVVALGIAIFLGVDIFLQLGVTIKNPKFPIQRYIVNCLVHHTASILACCVPLILDEDRMYKWVFCLLSVELNTALLKWRRILDRKTCEFRWVNYFFYITWFGIRVIMFPIFTVYIWYIYFSEESSEVWYLIGALSITILCGLYAVWTYNLMDKKTRRTKLGKKVAQVAIA